MFVVVASRRVDLTTVDGAINETHDWLKARPP